MDVEQRVGRNLRPVPGPQQGEGISDLRSGDVVSCKGERKCLTNAYKASRFRTLPLFW